MRIHPFSRRAFLTRSAVAAAAAPLFWTPAAQAAMPMPKAAGPLDENLDAFVVAYMSAMNAPGLTLGLTDAAHSLRSASYGFANLEEKLPLTPDHLFQIGSITKSFVALVLLQLRDEGKLDLHKPILDYLPWLPIREDFGPITIHHLLTHTSGLPDNQSFLSSDPNARLIQGFKPGEHFHYCNAGFDILGELVAKPSGKTRSTHARANSRPRPPSPWTTPQAASPPHPAI
jgi:D-alanyl-D-alanine carboxypeptidase